MNLSLFDRERAGAFCRDDDISVLHARLTADHRTLRGRSEREKPPISLLDALRSKRACTRKVRTRAAQRRLKRSIFRRVT